MLNDVRIDDDASLSLVQFVSWVCWRGHEHALGRRERVLYATAFFWE